MHVVFLGGIKQNLLKDNCKKSLTKSKLLIEKNDVQFYILFDGLMTALPKFHKKNYSKIKNVAQVSKSFSI